MFTDMKIVLLTNVVELVLPVEICDYYKIIA